MTDTDQTPAVTALERLATALDPARFVTTLITGTGRVLHLAVANRRFPQLTESIYAADRSFWWSWAERLGPVEDPLTAAQKVATVLHTEPEPSHG
jgi:hypothetical protein